MKTWKLDSTSELISQVSVNGKSVLEIGFGGDMAIAAIQAGAASASACDLGQKQILQAERKASAASVVPTLSSANIESSLPDKADIVICGPLNSYRDPLRVLRTIALSAKEAVVLVNQELQGKKIRKQKEFQGIFGRRRLRELNNSPVAYLSPLGDAKWSPNFIPTISGLSYLLDGHMRLFQSVEHSFIGEHLLTIAKRLRIDHLVVVAGCNSAGKSTLCQMLRDDQFPDIFKESLSDSIFVAPSTLTRGATKATFPDPTEKTAIFHYDISSAEDLGTNYFSRDISTDILFCANRTTHVLVAPSPELLRTQLASAQKNRYLTLFDESDFLSGLYSEWIGFASSISHNSKFLLYTDVGTSRQLTDLASASEAHSAIREIYSS